MIGGTMRPLFSRLFKRRAPRTPIPTPAATFADILHRSVMLAHEREGAKDRLLEARLKTIADEGIVSIYAADLRAVIAAARDNQNVPPKTFRLQFDWLTGKLLVRTGREHLPLAPANGLIDLVSYVLDRIRRDDLLQARDAAVHASERFTSMSPYRDRDA